MLKEMGSFYLDGNTDDINSRKELSEYRLEKAESCLVEAKALLEIDKYEGAVFL